MEGRRGKQKQVHTIDIGMPQFYKFYKSLYFKKLNAPGIDKRTINRESAFYMNYKLFKGILGDFNNALKDEILYNNFTFKLPYRMGELGIRKYKPKLVKIVDDKVKITASVDWHNTIKLWENDPVAKEKKKLVRFTNEHTKGYTVRWRWLKSTTFFNNSYYYKFISCRTANVDLAKAIKDNKVIDFYIS